MPAQCAMCEAMLPGNSKRCSGCQEVSYCNERCQNEHWVLHIFDCQTNKPIGTVYYLARACRLQHPPVHAPTRLEYGFEKIVWLVGPDKEHDLLRMYERLLRQVSPKDLRQWQRQGHLVRGIQSAFDALPPHERGPTFSWFLEHQHILDKPADFDFDRMSALAEKDAAALVRAGWLRMGGAPSATPLDIAAALGRMPGPERFRAGFYCTALAGWLPLPSQQAWVRFGFVAQPSQAAQAALARAYAALAAACPFLEFSAAHASGAVPALFARHAVAVPHPRLFADVMSTPPAHPAPKSVWFLKQHVDIVASTPPDDLARNGSSRGYHVEAFRIDYGYVRCRSAGDGEPLDALYARLFAKMEQGVDPLELHEACAAGRLAEYAGRFVKLDAHAEEYARLLSTGRGVMAESGAVYDVESVFGVRSHSRLFAAA
ncbi:uncharacterized protein BXZ73DRAFT_99561 [Epithele typhae]|uniref:uncharacterized protein n=1 Tax=Epithele typhae TaxID=378194 RepID=UPI00200850EB|nr:uncharacterized protein BXZ73DRAFT_99561 [Epithele typhae]KAH9939358.1 hypothetical protein BXZ73DRAFT_99561 [Epithele typhae]